MDNLDRDPGLKYPTNIPNSVPIEVQQVIRNIYDNLFFDRKHIDNLASLIGISGQNLQNLIQQSVVQAITSSTTTTTTTGILVRVSTHAIRVSVYGAAADPVGTIFIETDRTAIYYISDASGIPHWEFAAGQMVAPKGGLPADLGVNDIGFTFTATEDHLHTQYVWSGTGWLTVGPALPVPPGADGIDGEDGPPGPIGMTGPQGGMGIPGPPGYDGEQGDPGDPGVIGPSGPAGAAGSPGGPGIPGPPGLDGIDGTDGDPGPMGLTGPAGSTGGTGATGLPGPPGDPGIDGNDGDPGAIGLTGSQGIQGATGIQGPPGYDGVDGDEGMPGRPGDQGDGAGLRYRFDTVSAGVPAAGTFKYVRLGGIATTTTIVISNFEENGNDVSTYIQTWDNSTNPVGSGYLIIKSNKNGGSTVNTWLVLMTVLPVGAAENVQVSYISGSLPANGEECTIEFIPTGDRGAIGNQGVQGIQGPPGTDADPPEDPIVIPGPAGPAGASGGAGNTGTATLDFGAFPGSSDASIAITGQAAIVAGSIVQAWIRPVATVDHTDTEHMVETLMVFAGNIIAGTGFTIYGFNTSQLNEPVIPPTHQQSAFEFSTTDVAALVGIKTSTPGSGNPGVSAVGGGGQGTRIYGQYTVAWRWS